MTQHNVMHRIRLKKPWHREDHAERSGDERVSATASDGILTTSHRVDVPDREPPDREPMVPEVHPAVARGVRRVIYRRQFHRPSGLESGDRVLLEVGAARGRLVGIRLNTLTISVSGVSGGGSDSVDGLPENGQLPVRLRLDERLARHNDLEIELESTSDATGPPRLIGEVNLLIVERD